MDASALLGRLTNRDATVSNGLKMTKNLHSNTPTILHSTHFRMKIITTPEQSEQQAILATAMDYDAIFLNLLVTGDLNGNRMETVA